jgi:HSP20 family protein
MPTIVYRDGGVDPALLWNPFSLFDQLERAAFGGHDWFEWPHFDSEETDDELLLTADMPGMSDEDVEITVSGSLLIVRGERKPSTRARRRPYGSFERRFRIADGFDLENVEAELSHGVLAVRIPKLPKAKPRRIKLASGASGGGGGGGVLSKVKGLLGADKSEKSDDK